MKTPCTVWLPGVDFMPNGLLITRKVILKLVTDATFRNRVARLESNWSREQVITVEISSIKVSHFCSEFVIFEKFLFNFSSFLQFYCSHLLTKYSRKLTAKLRDWMLPLPIVWCHLLPDSWSFRESLLKKAI